ncbi:MAG TPA: hypothetical protein VGE12_20650, partial [Noviherbaspirillum sp.]
MSTTIFDKTDKGREEISTRKYQLAPRLRTLLVLVDGKQPKDELLKKVTGIGLTEESIEELVNNGFIQAIAAPEPPTPVEATPTEEPAQQAQKASGNGILPEGQTQFQAIYQFYNETIRSTIGLRGYALQLKVEKAATIDELRELRKPYLEAVLKAKGNEM